MTQHFDCQSCGACCCNSARNMKVGSRDYVEIERSDALSQSRDLLRELAERRNRAWFMKLVDDEERCVALDGVVGDRVSCSIYVLRPQGCRRVNAGDSECIAARKLHGLPVDEKPRRAKTK